MIKLAIFDLDGVLVDACEWHRVALNESLEKLARYKISLSDHYGIFNGLPTRVKLEKLSRLGHVEESMHNEICELKQELTIKIIEEKSIIRKEKIILLNWLKKENIKIACCTNSIRKTAELMLEKAGIIEMFETIITNQDVSKPKPDPEGYLKIMKHFNCSPKETMIIEDSEKGVEAAKASGGHVIRVKNQEEVNLELVSAFLKELK